MRYNVCVTECADFGAGVAGVLILLVLLGSCGDSHSSSKYEDSYTEEIAYTEECYIEECSEASDYVELDYDEEFSEDFESDYPEDECTECDEEPVSLYDLCFYSGDNDYSLNHMVDIEDCFGNEHDALYNRHYFEEDSLTETGVFTYRFCLNGQYSKLTFNSCTSCGDPTEYGDAFIKVSYSDDCTDEETVWERRIYGGTLVETDSIDLSGAIFMSVTIAPFQCPDGYFGDCYALIGDFVLE